MSDPTTEAQVQAAQAGDQQAFTNLVEPYRPELLVHCYRLLGSIYDAEDMVQETFLRAWDRLSSFTGGAYFRAWLYKIATNNCLDALDRRPRRVLSPANFPASDPQAPFTPVITEPIWLEPFPDELLPALALSPEARYTQRESITLAFLAALQLLPPRQRVILILCDVLDWRAHEAAQLLDLTVSAVNSARHRARLTMKTRYRAPELALPADDKLRNVLDRYVEAWESGDVATLITLLKQKVVFTMPPSPSWYSGREAVRVHAQAMLRRGPLKRWRLRPTRANNQIALACYRLEEATGRYYAHALQLITFAGQQMVEIQMFFLPLIFPFFGLPPEWNESRGVSD